MQHSGLWPNRATRLLVGALALATALASALPAAAGDENGGLLLQDHELAGTLWDTRSGRQIAEADLVAAALAADWILLGEKHDNAAHHQLQARIIDAIGATGRRPAVVWEMAGPDQAEAFAGAKIDQVSFLGQALGWEERGWPAWSIYQPIAEAALRNEMPMYPGNPSPELTRAVGHGESLDPEQAARLAWERDYDPDQRAALTDQMAAAHCNAMPAAAMAPMVDVQRLRDAWMAASLREADGGSGAILIAGSQHVREDRGVPWRLEEDVFSLALIEVDRAGLKVEDYPAFDPTKFDFVWFTARVDEDDPCEKFFGKSSG